MLSILESLQYSETLADGDCVARGGLAQSHISEASLSLLTLQVHKWGINFPGVRQSLPHTYLYTHTLTHTLLGWSEAPLEPVSSSHEEINQPAQSELTSLQSTVFQFSLLSSRSLASALDSWWCRLFCIFFTDFWEIL